MRYSERWKHGIIYDKNTFVYPNPPLHPNCRCKIESLQALLAGHATIHGTGGADFYLKYFEKLPSYYITEEEAKKLGYKSYLGNLSVVAPDKMLMKGVYQNKNGKLPSADGRVWYEADINYTKGYRGGGRILFSNDGLIFVTYDQYLTFQEII